jgi:hypothetical protein
VSHVTSRARDLLNPIHTSRNKNAICHVNRQTAGPIRCGNAGARGSNKISLSYSKKKERTKYLHIRMVGFHERGGPTTGGGEAGGGGGVWAPPLFASFSAWRASNSSTARRKRAARPPPWPPPPSTHARGVSNASRDPRVVRSFFF